MHCFIPCCDVTSSWAFDSLLTKTRICRTQWRKMVISVEFVEKMNVLNLGEEAIDPVGNDLQSSSGDAQQSDCVATDNENGLEQADVVERPGDEPRKDPEGDAEENEDISELDQ
jgi:hypothetical protein